MKNELRIEMRRLELERAAYGNMAEADARIRAALATLDALKNAESVAGYIPMRGEVDLTPLLAELAVVGATILIPRSERTAPNAEQSYVMAETDAAFLRGWSATPKEERGAFGIPEPSPDAPVVPNDSVAVWLVPALAFDKRGARLGRGGGFYDRLLSGSGGLKIGVGYENIVLEELPCDDWDQRMDAIVTERRVLWI